MLIQLQVLVGIAKCSEITFELPFLYHHGGAAVIGVEAERMGVLQCLIEEEVYVALLVVDESKGRHAAWLQPEILHHPFG